MPIVDPLPVLARQVAGERVVVAMSGGHHGRLLADRARALAGEHGSVLALHVSGGRSKHPARDREELRLLVEATGGSWHTVLGEDVATVVADFARAHHASQVVLGGSGRGTAATLAARGLEVHLVPSTDRGPGRSERFRTWYRRQTLLGVSRARQLAGFGLGALVLGLGTPLLIALRGSGSFGNELLLYLLAIVVVSLVGGVWPALSTALLASFAADWWLVPPLHRLAIADSQESVALVVFVSVALLVSAVVSLAARRSREASRAGAEAETLATLAESVLRGEQALPALLTRVRESFGGRAVRLMELTENGWHAVAESTDDEDATGAGLSLSRVPLGERLRLELESAELSQADHRVLVAFAAHAAVVLEQRRIADIEVAASRTAEIDRVRTALLGAVSHDLRTPLAAAKAAVNGLLDATVDWQPEQRRELLGTADHSLDTLTRLVDDLLDMSRLQVGVLPVQLEALALEDVVNRAVQTTSYGRLITIELADDLPLIVADPVLLERVVANLLQNAFRHGPADPPPSIGTSSADGQLHLAIRDHGPGIPVHRLDEAFAPFQRLGDRPDRDGAGESAGVGLGLAIARGLTTAMGGDLIATRTPGGGLTMTLGFPVARDAHVPT